MKSVGIDLRHQRRTWYRTIGDRTAAITMNRSAAHAFGWAIPSTLHFQDTAPCAVWLRRGSAVVAASLVLWSRAAGALGAPCVGDCDDSVTVSVSELIVGVN